MKLASSTSLTATVPAATAPGLYTLVMKATNGRVRVVRALTIGG